MTKANRCGDNSTLVKPLSSIFRLLTAPPKFNNRISRNQPNESRSETLEGIVTWLSFTQVLQLPGCLRGVQQFEIPRTSLNYSLLSLHQAKNDLSMGLTSKLKSLRLHRTSVSQFETASLQSMMLQRHSKTKRKRKNKGRRRRGCRNRSTFAVAFATRELSNY